ncbi:hypothetical protein N0V93_001036 [Gnomoniopsis smithogilvyi]|uniref:Uncharacterized protein n=1 Tax=Gnomoniopsis smithogilvyi TaxID=1191159 RepID=A0A9W9D1W0_9PEZI|nr:hypothetical protein N0V93_001036 [Gnomoniopsis smithogilvyi]
MANGTFFTSWQLWEELTFVLAMGIVIVFLFGLVKLRSTNRQMRKLEILDAEKQRRVTQMLKSGLSPNSRYRIGSEIPFGVKALEGGVEVDGIWTAKKTSMASQPPNRKWSSRRNVRAPSSSLVEMGDLVIPNRRAMTGPRGSKRASKISRREIVEPSLETREKLGTLCVPEEAEGFRANEQAKAAYSSHKGPLGRIQRGLKKMTSLELWQDQERKRSAGRVDVGEFREKAQAKKPQRFYPESSSNSNTTPPLAAPIARIHTAQNRLESPLTSHGASQAARSATREYVTERQPASAAGSSSRSQTGVKENADKAFTAHRAQIHNPRQRGSSDSRLSSADSFVTSAELPEKPSIPVQIPGPHARRLSADGHKVREAPVIPVRRSSRSSEHVIARQSAEARRSEERSCEAAQAFPQAPTAPVARYPPNSSRSGPVVQRSQSLGRYSKQQQ